MKRAPQKDGLLIPSLIKPSYDPRAAFSQEELGELKYDPNRNSFYYGKPLAEAIKADKAPPSDDLTVTKDTTPVP